MTHSSIKKITLILCTIIGIEPVYMHAVDLNDLKDPVVLSILAGVSVVSGGVCYFIGSSGSRSLEAKKIELQKQQAKQEHEEETARFQRARELEDRLYRDNKIRAQQEQEHKDRATWAWNNIANIASEFEPIFKQPTNIEQLAHSRDLSHGISPLLSLDQQLTSLINTIKDQLPVLTAEQQEQALNLAAQLGALKSVIDPALLKNQYEEQQLWHHKKELREQEIMYKKQETRLLQAQTAAAEQKGNKYIRAQDAIIAVRNESIQAINSTEQKATENMSNTALVTMAIQATITNEVRDTVKDAKKEILQEILDDADARGKQVSNHLKQLATKVATIDEHLGTVNENLQEIHNNTK